ncbi:transmembrane protease serine 9-like [Odontomachus brunneus]|uniref:transmembrane protease serine 9-like n=1 Tax=Odontomachus brunneus TaxID=486640 RepID=UPI0013F2AAC7|nr:transmembrane protease serine 9-like [Odontomachus brunneus]
MLLQSFLVTVLVFQACLASPLSLKPRITDGTDATPGEFPYQVSIQLGFPPFVPYQHNCGGSILDETTILTAGHCISKFGSLKVVAGKYFLMDDEDSNQESLVNRVKVHELYTGDIAQHDIAIIKLATPFVFNDKVSAVQLPPQNEIETGDAVLSGWGSISKDFLPILPSVLQKVTIPILDNVSCLRKFPKDITGTQPELYDTQICTDSTKGESACSGDSGGPLVQFQDKVAKQIGIVSWGVYPCGVDLMPSVYTRTSSYIDWINKNRRIFTYLLLRQILLISDLQSLSWITMDYHVASSSISCVRTWQKEYKTQVEYRFSSNINMSPKVIVLFALLAVAFAEKPHLGFRIPQFDMTQVVGGEEAPAHEYSFIVSLQWGKDEDTLSHFCAGSIVNNKIIVTAGHCVHAVPDDGLFAIKAGKHDINSRETGEQMIKVKNAVVHENYQGGVGPYDIAVLELESELKFNDNIQPIDLPEEGSKPSGTPILCGWGSTSRSSIPSYPSKLQHVKMVYVNIPDCDAAVKRLTGSSPVHETNVCTGPLSGGISACSGDSGGPLFEITSKGPVLTGIVSWGIIPCGTTGAPSVYGGVSNFTPWIIEQAAK